MLVGKSATQLKSSSDVQNKMDGVYNEASPVLPRGADVGAVPPLYDVLPVSTLPAGALEQAALRFTRTPVCKPLPMSACCSISSGAVIA